MGYLINICVTFVFIGMTCLTELLCSSQCSDLGKAIEISSSKLYIIPSAMMEVSHQGEDFLVSTSLTKNILLKATLNRGK